MTDNETLLIIIISGTFIPVVDIIIYLISHFRKHKTKARALDCNEQEKEFCPFCYSDDTFKIENNEYILCHDCNQWWAND